MALVLVDGFEGANTVLSGWTPATLNYSSGLARKSPKGNGGDYCIFRQAATYYRYFPLNNDTQSPLMLREVFMSGAIRPTVANQFQVRFGLGRSTTEAIAINPYPATNELRVVRFNTQLAITSTPVVPDQWNTWRLRALASPTSGQVEVRSANSDTPIFNLTGVGTVEAGNAWFDQMMMKFDSQFTATDDLVIQAPTIRLAGIAGPRPPMDTLLTGGTSGATVLVSEAEFARNRVWVHSWNGTPFINGETISGGGFSATVVAPGANFVDGFEPNSFWTRGVPFVLAGAPTADGAVALTPTPGAPNVNNINDIPENNTQFNSISSGTPAEDTYTGVSALPSWVTRVYGVCPDAFAGQDGTDYANMRVILSDPTGSDSHQRLLLVSGYRNFYSFDTRSDGSSWSPSDIPLLSLTYRMEG